MTNRLRILIITVFSFLLLLSYVSTVCGQSAEGNQDDSGEGFIFLMDFSHDENQKAVEQTGYSDTNQKTVRSIYSGGIGYLPLFFTGGIHREQSIVTTYGDKKTNYADKTDAYGVWALLFFGAGQIKFVEDYKADYNNGHPLKEDSEITISAKAGIIPIFLDNPVLVGYSESDVNFTYKLDVGTAFSTDEEIDFKVNMVHLLKVIQLDRGPSIGGLFNKVVSFKPENGRNGEIDGVQYGLEFGFVFDSGLSILIGGSKQESIIEVESQDSNGTLTRKSDVESSRLAFKYPVSEEVSMVLEQRTRTHFSLNKDSDNLFKNQKNAYSRATSIGVVFNGNLRIDLLYGIFKTKIRDENNVYVNPVYRYSFSDETIGLKIGYRFTN